MPVERPIRLSPSETDGDESQSIVGLQANEHRTPAIFLRIGDRRADIGRARDFLLADLQDDIAGLETVLSTEAVGINIGDHDTVAAAAGGRERETQPRYVEAGRRHGWRLIAGLTLGR